MKVTSSEVAEWLAWHNDGAHFSITSRDDDSGEFYIHAEVIACDGVRIRTDSGEDKQTFRVIVFEER